MTLPLRINEAMQMQVEAERKKRASILESEGKFRSNEETRGFLYYMYLHVEAKHVTFVNAPLKS